jgi:probable rRNA maturation factor
MKRAVRIDAAVDVTIDPDARRLSAELAARLRRQLRRMVVAAARTEGQSLEAAFRLTTDPVIHALNRDFRSKNKPTDVLAFAQREGPRGAAPPGVLGDVIVSVDTAVRQARRRGPNGLWTEIRFLAAHGLCHLLGYDHQNDTEEAIMNTRMAALLAEADRTGAVRPA